MSFSATDDPKYGRTAIPIAETIQNEISLSTTVTAALTDGETPAAE